MTVIWIIVLVAAILLEIASSALISIWFCAGALGALIAAMLGANLAVQLVIFTLLSGLLLAFTRPLIKKLLPNKYTPTNAELAIGKSAVVTEGIDNDTGKGRVVLGGVNWAAVSVNGEKIPEGETVRVAEVRSAKLAVETPAKADPLNKN